MRFDAIQSALKGAVQQVYHYRAPNGAAAPYVVWAEDGEARSAHADNRKLAQAVTGTIDLFTRTEYDIRVDEIQTALNDAEVSWWLNSVQYEDETKLIHYEWVWEAWRK